MNGQCNKGSTGDVGRSCDDPTQGSDNRSLGWIKIVKEFFFMKVGVHQGSVLSSLIFAIVADVLTEDAREVMMNKILNVNDLILTSETMEDLQESF